MDQTTSVKVTIEHVIITADKPFDEVKGALERQIPHLDSGIFTLIRFGAVDRALDELKKLPPLSIFGSRNHGALLSIAGRRAQAIQYDIGNPLTASLMTRHDLSAALYAPVRVLLRQDDRGVTAFEYDRPATTFTQFGNADVTKVAEALDKQLHDALLSAARGS